jgi:hypothetical protein
MKPHQVCKIFPNTRREQWVGAVELDGGTPPLVFTFYAHNSQQHAEAVRRFAIFPSFKMGNHLPRVLAPGRSNRYAIASGHLRVVSRRLDTNRSGDRLRPARGAEIVTK